MIARLLIHFPLAESLHDSCRGTEVVMTLAERRLLTVQSSQQKEGRIFYEDIQGFRPAPGHRRHGYGTIARILSAARVGLRFIQAGALLLQCSMLFAAVVLCTAAAVPALAQGSVLGNDASRPVSLAKHAIDVLAWGMILYGVFGLGKGVFRGINGQQGWAQSIGWGTGGLGFGFLTSWINS